MDFKLLKDVHEKLVNGKEVETHIINILLLGGINNVLCQSEVVEDTFERVKVLEVENLTSKTRLEFLENWVLKLNENDIEVRDKIGKLEDVNSSNFEAKIDALDREISSLKKNPEKAHSPCGKSCSECKEKFSKNCDLENHMVEVHGCEKLHSCEICGKSFLLKWRLKKHASVHDSRVKACKYFENGKGCLYDEIGCMFKHSQDETEDTEEVIDDIEDSEEAIEDNFCYYCNSMCTTQQDLIEHMGNVHLDLFTHLHEDRSKSTS